MDLNITGFNDDEINDFKKNNCAFVGLKVSYQNFKYAIELTKSIKKYHSEIPVIWGGEYPSLAPGASIEYADAFVVGAFENIGNQRI